MFDEISFVVESAAKASDIVDFVEKTLEKEGLVRISDIKRYLDIKNLTSDDLNYGITSVDGFSIRQFADGYEVKFIKPTYVGR